MSVIQLTPLIILIIMKDVIIGVLVLAVIIFCWILVLQNKDTSNTSSPVEEMYHRELVTILDSILDSRFACGVYADDSIDYVSSVDSY